jgi:hypothetical protein
MNVAEGPEQPKEWIALPGRRGNPWAAFMRSLTDLAAALGVAVPAGLHPDREGCWTVKRLVLEAIKERRPLAEELFAPLMAPLSTTRIRVSTLVSSSHWSSTSAVAGCSWR